MISSLITDAYYFVLLLNESSKLTLFSDGI